MNLGKRGEELGYGRGMEGIGIWDGMDINGGKKG